MGPEIIPPTFITTRTKFPKNMVLNSLWLIIDEDIGLLVPASLPQVIVKITDIGLLRPATILLDSDIIVLIFVEVYLGHKRPYTLPNTIGNKS